MAPLLRDLVTAVTSVLVAAGERGVHAVHAALVDEQAPPGSRSVALGGDDDVDERVAAAQQAARGWVAQGERALHAALAAETHQGARATRRRRRVRRVVGDPVLAAVALTAAAGVVGAAELLNAVLGGTGAVVVEDLRGQLSVLAANQVDLERAAVDAVLRQRDLAPDAASALRLRLAVLKALT